MGGFPYFSPPFGLTLASYVAEKKGHQMAAVLFQKNTIYMGVSNNRGTPKWMVYNRKTLLKYIKMDDLGVPPFSETSIWQQRMVQVIQNDLCIPWLEVTNNLWKGQVFTIPKRVTKNHLVVLIFQVFLKMIRDDGSWMDEMGLALPPTSPPPKKNRDDG